MRCYDGVEGEAEMLSDERLAEMRGRVEAATPAPWTAWYDSDEAEGVGKFDINTPQQATGGYVFRMHDDHVVHVGVSVAPDNGVCIANDRLVNRGYDTDSGEPVRQESVPLKPHDAAFIAHARQDIPDLLAEVDRLRVELAELR